jgi:hypothetical protein
MDWPDKLYQMWEQFERVHSSSVQDYHDAKQKIRGKLAQAQSAAVPETFEKYILHTLELDKLGIRFLSKRDSM